MIKKSFNARSFLSIGTFLLFMLLTVSGMALHFLDHKSPTFVLVYFKVSHTIFAMCFLIFSVGHIWKNWNAIKSYMSEKAKKTVSKEMLIGIIIAIVILVTTWIKATDMAKEHGIPLWLIN